MDRFLGSASAASRALPGERLNQRIAELQTTYTQFEQPCDEAFLADYEAQLVTLNELLTLLEQWANGELDGTQFSMAFDSTYSALR